MSVSQRDIHVCEVGLRDGLQLVGTILPTHEKKRLVDLLAGCGLPEIDAGNFVSPKVIAQFFDADEIVAYAAGAARAMSGWSVGAVIPNECGLERALAADVDAVYAVISVSQTHNLSNLRKSREDQIEVIRVIAGRIAALPADKRPRLVAALATSFGCSLEGRIDPADVCRLAATMRGLGADEICLADTVGYGDPALVRATVAAVRAAVGQDTPLRLHLHDTMGLGLSNALAALDIGVDRFDAALSGLGGCPFAPGASGNIATEDLVFMLHQMGLRTGIDLPRLIDASTALSSLLPQERIRSHVREAALPKVYRG